MKASLRKKIREIEVYFHRRAFGEEMARINFLPLSQRKLCLAGLHARSRKKRNLLK